MSVNIVNKTTGDLTTVAGISTDKVGNLNALTTTDKTSIVGGINELKSVTDTCIKNGDGAARVGGVYLGVLDGPLVYTENGDVNFRTGSNGNYDVYTSIRQLRYCTTCHNIDNDYTFADLIAETNITWFTNWNDTVNFPVLYGSGVLIPAGDPSQKAIIYIAIGDTANGEVYTNIYKFGAWGGWNGPGLTYGVYTVSDATDVKDFIKKVIQQAHSDLATKQAYTLYHIFAQYEGFDNFYGTIERQDTAGYAFSLSKASGDNIYQGYCDLSRDYLRVYRFEGTEI